MVSKLHKFVNSRMVSPIRIGINVYRSEIGIQIKVAMEFELESFIEIMPVS